MIFNTDLHLDIDNGVSLGKVDKFCYLGDMLFTDGECDSTETARVGPSVYSRPLWGKIPPPKKIDETEPKSLSASKTQKPACKSENPLLSFNSWFRLKHV